MNPQSLPSLPGFLEYEKLRIEINELLERVYQLDEARVKYRTAVFELNSLPEIINIRASASFRRLQAHFESHDRNVTPDLESAITNRDSKRLSLILSKLTMVRLLGQVTSQLANMPILIQILKDKIREGKFCSEHIKKMFADLLIVFTEEQIFGLNWEISSTYSLGKWSLDGINADRAMEASRVLRDGDQLKDSYFSNGINQINWLRELVQQFQRKYFVTGARFSDDKVPEELVTLAEAISERNLANINSEYHYETYVIKTAPNE